MFQLIQSYHQNSDDDFPMDLLQSVTWEEVMARLVEIVSNEVDVHTTDAQVVAEDEEVNDDSVEEKGNGCRD